MTHRGGGRPHAEDGVRGAGVGGVRGVGVRSGLAGGRGGRSLPVAGPGPWADRDDFPGRAAKALANDQLRANLRNATATIRSKRAAMVAATPDWPELRSAARAGRDRSLLAMDHWLEALEAAVKAAGGVVHWARDAVEANAIVVGLVREHGADEVVKVKSNTTDETRLNDALSAAGIRAVETDLAELIIQLAGEASSHFLVPAIHKNRREIRDVFRATIGPADLSDDPAELAEAARLHLRRKFLSARVGISGANFAIAETGTVGVVESEGNGRMCLTLPEVLVSVMGVEKVVPSWRDLEPLLQLLPRSATGERMNPYNSLWTGVTPGDGPRQFHLVLLDNGRSRVLADAVGRQALRCIRCSACLNVCPVYERVGGHAYGSVYAGPIGAILTPQLLGPRRADSLPFASSLCGACAEVCPVEIDIPGVLVHLRDRAVRTTAAGPARGRWTMEWLALRALAWLFRAPRRYERAQRLLRLMSRWPLVRRGRFRRLPGWAGGWTKGRDLPAAPERTFREWWEGRASAPRDRRPPAHDGRTSRGARDAGAGAGSAAPVAPASGGTAGPPVDAASVSGTASPDSARAVVLARIRASLADVPAAERGRAVGQDIDRSYRVADDERGTVLDLFEERLAEHGAVVRRVTRADLPGAVAAACEARDADAVVVPWDLPERWVEKLDPAGIDIVHGLPPVDGVHGLTHTDLDQAGAVITTCAVAVAETGTLILDSGPGQGRRALSLVPDYHLCVVPAERVVATLPEGLAAVRGAAHEGRPLTLVSGPSATSDIELRRVEGVHGPRRLEVMVVV